jgi:hypothetical protein
MTEERTRVSLPQAGPAVKTPSQLSINVRTDPTPPDTHDRRPLSILEKPAE